jgi:hypothetical protein
MPRGKGTFRTSDIRRAIRSAAAGGFVAHQIEIRPSGEIVPIAAADGTESAVIERGVSDDANMTEPLCDWCIRPPLRA